MTNAWRTSFIALIVALLFGSFAAATDESSPLSDDELTGLKASVAAMEVFQQFPDSIWPGYDLAHKPFLFYMPGKWALLFNYSGEVDGFTTTPSHWPPLGAEVLYHEGQYGDLAGQLSFAIPIDESVRVAAVPCEERSAPDLFAFIVHENFHEYQKFDRSPTFGEIPWEREERYPIEDTENTALAFLEMELLMNAFAAMESGDDASCRENLSEFVAVRDHRWRHMNPFVERYEQGEELNEGTAAYVEKKALALLGRLTPRSALTKSLAEEMASFSLSRHMREKYGSVTTGRSISPEDVARNRIYPVGATLGLLADHLGIAWKAKAQAAGTGFSFARLFQEKLDIGEDDLDALLKKAKITNDYEAILRSTEDLIVEYRKGFERELAIFEGQSGERVEVTVRRSGLLRSRSSTAKKWLADQGTRELRSHFTIYSLSDAGLLLQIHKSAVLELDDWENGIMTVVFYVPEISRVVVDSVDTDLSAGKRNQFRTLEMTADNFTFETSKPGAIVRGKNRVAVNLVP